MSYIEKNKTQRTEGKAIQKILTSQESITGTPKADSLQIRRLKLKPFYRQSAALYDTSTKIVPELRLCGDWLQEAGFHPNDYVDVTVKDGLLIIRSASEPSTN